MLKTTSSAMRLTISVSLAVFMCGCKGDDRIPIGQNVDVIRPLQLMPSARIPENDPSLSDVTVTRTDLTFIYSATPTIPLEAGHVVAGVRGGGYLRKVVSVDAADPNNIIVATVPARLTDFILDGAFRVRRRGAGTEWTDAGDVSKQALALESESKLSVFSPEIIDKGSGFQCGLQGIGNVKLTPVMDIDLDFDVLIDIRSTGTLSAELHQARFIASGSLTVGMDIEMAASVQAICMIDLIRLLRDQLSKPDLFKYELPKTTFAIGPVPIVITHTIEPTAAFEMTAMTTLDSLTAKKRTTYGLRVGAEYAKKDGWTGIWEPTRSGSFLVETETPRNVTLGAELSAGLKYVALIYDVAGPKIGIEGALAGSIRTVHEPVCETTISLDAAIKAVVGAELQIPFFEVTLAEYTQKFILASKNLFKKVLSFKNECGPAPDGGLDLPDPFTDGPLLTDGGADADNQDASGDGALDGGNDAGDGGTCVDPIPGFPFWYGGTAESPACDPMYAKVYGPNPQCATDDDCHNPCGLLCCGAVNRLERVRCLSGFCTFDFSQKCQGGVCSANPQANCDLPSDL